MNGEKVDFESFNPGAIWVEVEPGDPETRQWVAGGPDCDLDLVGATLTLKLFEDRL